MVIALYQKRLIAFIKFVGVNVGCDKIDALNVKPVLSEPRGGGVMHILPIRNDEDHETALREIEALWDAEDGTQPGDRLDVLATLVETYERGRWPIEPLDPMFGIGAAMELNGYTRGELAALIGHSSATEILAQHRVITLQMIARSLGLDMFMKSSRRKAMRWLRSR